MVTPEFRRGSHQIIIYYIIRYYRNEWKNRSQIHTRFYFSINFKIAFLIFY